MAGKYVLSKQRGGKFRFNLKASNGKVILSSQGYKTKDGAMSGIKSVQKNGKSDKRFERKKAKNGAPYFTLVATNGEVIGTSEMYSSNAAMENGIRSVITNAGSAVQDDS